jgi:hypothetical protein
VAKRSKEPSGQRSRIDLDVRAFAIVREATNTARACVVFDWLATLVDPQTNPWFREEYVDPRDVTAERAAAPDQPPPRAKRD